MTNSRTRKTSAVVQIIFFDLYKPSIIKNTLRKMAIILVIICSDSVTEKIDCKFNDSN